MRALVTVIGSDSVGIIYNVTGVFKEHDVNIIDVNQTVLENYFAMFMLVDLSKCKTEFKVLKDILENTGKDIGLSVRIQREDIFNAMHNI